MSTWLIGDCHFLKMPGCSSFPKRGSGKTGLPLARLLQNANQPVLLASRGIKSIPEPFQGVNFHWDDHTTHEKLFSTHTDIDRAYLIGPEAHMDILSIMKPFVELAITNGVKRFVLLTATTTPIGPSGMGEMHKYLGNRGVEYCILRPTWFIENFAEFRLSGILNHNTIMTATGDGRIPFVSAEDIADVAFRALTDEKSHNTEHLVVGPELYSHDEAVKMLSEILGREITHTRMSHDEAIVFWRQFVPTEFAGAMVQIEDAVALGDEEAYFHANVKEVGKRHLRAYFEANREVWVKYYGPDQ